MPGQITEKWLLINHEISLLEDNVITFTDRENRDYNSISSNI